MLLDQLQSKLQVRYDLNLPYRIEHFVTSDRQVANELADAQASLGQQRPDIDEELVFIQQHRDSLEFTVYFDEELLDSVIEQRSDLDGMCTVVEGASHAVCLLWHAHYDRQVRSIDLELQAEVDKFMLLIENHEDPLERRKLHRRLFVDSRIMSASDSSLHERYRVASQYASQYCHWLNNRFIDNNDHVALHGELARFYRLSGRAKFDHIQRLH